MVKTFFPLLVAFSAEGYEAGNCRGEILQRFLVRALQELNYNRTIVYDSMAFIYSFGCILSPLAFVGLAAGSVFLWRCSARVIAGFLLQFPYCYYTYYYYYYYYISLVYLCSSTLRF